MLLRDQKSYFSYLNASLAIYAIAPNPSPKSEPAAKTLP